MSKVGNVSPVKYLQFDKENQKIEFQYYENYITLRKWANWLIIRRKFSSNINTIKNVYEIIGHFIALYHKTSKNSANTKYPLHENSSQPHKQQCFLHADLTDQNIIINEDNKVVILDWESSPIVDEFFNYGSALWDVVWFANTILRPSPGTYFNGKQRIQMVMFFLNGYEKIYKLDLKTFFKYYNDNVKELNEKIYKKKDALNKILLKRHYKNWVVLEEKLRSE